MQEALDFPSVAGFTPEVDLGVTDASARTQEPDALGVFELPLGSDSEIAVNAMPNAEEKLALPADLQLAIAAEGGAGVAVLAIGMVRASIR